MRNLIVYTENDLRKKRESIADKTHLLTSSVTTRRESVLLTTHDYMATLGLHDLAYSPGARCPGATAVAVYK